MDKRIVIGQTLGVVAAIFLGVGLYGYFAADAASFHPALGSSLVSGSMIAVGVLLTVIELGIMIPALRERQQQRGK